MSGLTADELLQGPRGRVLCVAVAHRIDQRVWSAWSDAAWNPGDAARLDALVGALDAVPTDLDGIWDDPATYVEPVAESIGEAMYWQPPHDEDAILAVPPVQAALRPLAAAIAAASATAWWSSPLEPNALRYTHWTVDRPAPPALTGSAKRLLEWRERTAAESLAFGGSRAPELQYTGSWWSTPAFHAVTTARPLGDLGSIELAWHEDSLGLRDALIWPLQTIDSPRVWEIGGPQAWADLVQAYPMEVTEQRRHDWSRVTGRPGPWCIPDWSAVARDWDGVHVSVTGYLTTATRALQLAHGKSATMLAGWNPDETWWLTDVLAQTTTGPERWHRTDDFSGSDLIWHRVS
ncbi:hypothetical protein ACVBEQ_25010 [Nakamurella sp. GG22]